MYVMKEQMTDLIASFHLPFGGQLNPDNRWVQLAQLVPWDRVENQYMEHFGSPIEGQEAYSVRVALGALIIQERMRLTDRETPESIQENPYLQFFIGYQAFDDKKPPFHHSLMTHFRKRLTPEILTDVNDWILEEAQKAEAVKAKGPSDHEPDDDDLDDPDDGQLTLDVGDALSVPEEPIASKRKNQVAPSKASSALDSNQSPGRGKLLLDATCAPADIKYPTDLGLLNQAREILETIIDTLHAPHIGNHVKPRTYRNKARKAYLSIAKQRQPRGKKIRKAIKKQLSFVRRNLQTIRVLSTFTPLTELSHGQYRRLLVIQTLYAQQRAMFERKTHTTPDRIVSIEQPHVRPIVRGKAGASVEFGAKVAISVVNGYARVDAMQWDAFNEAKTLQASVERYKACFGHYPEAILADKLYRNRENLQYCKARGIRLSGPRLGRPPKHPDPMAVKLERQDAAERNEVEGTFGTGKRKYGLDRIRAKLAHTSQTVISLQFLVMNLERRLRVLFFLVFRKSNIWVVWGAPH